MYLSSQEKAFCALLRDLPKEFGNVYSEQASNYLIQNLFHFLVGASEEYATALFNGNTPEADKRWSLRQAQGAVEGAEYTEAARGHPCGHIFKNGETTYRCRTCSSDDTCVLCARCFAVSDHEGHNVFVSLSPGNSGCCDCGDPEAWLRPVECGIHSVSASHMQTSGKMPDRSLLPPELVESIRMTISRSIDYMCDVFSCSPEQLRLPKTEDTVREDEIKSRLPAKVYGASDEAEDDEEFALVLWNDEKHTVNDVRDQVSRACKISKHQALKKAIEVDDTGRCIVVINKDLTWLLHAAKVIEQPKLTVTIRSARDTFREQMCATIIEWIADIAGCSVGPDHNLLRDTICEQFLRPWRVGSEAHHLEVGKDGLDDHEVEDMPDDFFRFNGRYPAQTAARFQNAWQGADDGEEGEDRGQDDDEAESEDDEDANAAGDEMDVDGAEWSTAAATGQQEMDLDAFDDSGPLEASEATLAGYPPPPPPPPHPRRRFLGVAVDSDEGETGFISMTVPKTPRIDPMRVKATRRPPKYWLERPELYRKQKDMPVAEDLERRVRLDYLILWDLRMWKQLRTDLRDVLISTVVTLPHFKRLLGLRFAGVYTVLAELYLIADREPDHSIINLSLQMLTTPSITAEIVERGNFLSNLLAIMYTFLTTRQVGYPSDVNTGATLAFEQGAVTNRRTYHFYMDLKYLLASELVQERIRSEDRYLLQFLDLAKLHQGICPNVRAVGEHVEFENDAWLSASIIVQEIIKLCKLVGECFKINSDQDEEYLNRAIRNTARAAIVHSLGAERRRFDTSEIRGETRFKRLDTFEFEDTSDFPPRHRVVDYIISQEPISFHHALHYTLSWLIDRGKAMSREQLINLLLFSSQELRQSPSSPKANVPETQGQENLLALFDFPLRVIAWLAQMRAGMWVRNGITLRHQMSAYRGHPRRELSFFRDIFLLQTAMVVLPPAQVLASMIDRFDLTDWIQGNHSLRNGQDEQQKIDIAEDFIHLLIILLCDRIHVVPLANDPTPQITTAKRDIVHTLCFKPLSYSQLCSHIPDKFSDTDQFDQLIQDMTVFRPPEGISDHGTFALKDQHYEDIDPYLAHFSRNQRDEAENIYKKHMAKKLGKDPAEIVYEPKLRKLEAGLFAELGSFTRTPLFAQIIFYLLQYTLVADRFAPNVPSTKVEQFLQFILHLTLVAVLEDPGEDTTIMREASPMVEDGPLTGRLDSFCRLALTKQAKHPIGNCDTIARLLRRIAADDTFKTCEPKVQLILRYLKHKRPIDWTNWMRSEGVQDERSQNATPDPLQDKELLKRQSLERQAKVMAQFKQQQNSFMQQNQAIDWGDADFSDIEEEFTTPAEEEHQIWNYPSGTCILCQEETNEDKLYGTFALINESRILRQTDPKDSDWVGEALHTPTSLDRSADDVRPFGVAGNNKKKVTKVTADGRSIELERQDLAQGFPMRHHTSVGPVASGCGHIMHYSCFEVYVQATQRRQMAAIARNHPERLDHKEFLCPLCKALGNAFLPVIWKGKPISYPGVLQPEDSFEHFLQHTVGVQISKMEKGPERPDSEVSTIQQRLETMFLDYGKQEMIGNIGNGLRDLTKVMPPSSRPVSPAPRQFTIPNLSILFSMGAEDPIPASALLSGMAGASSSDSSSIPLPVSPQIAELIKIYQRLRETMTTNNLPSSFRYTQPGQDELTHTDTLARALGYSISAIEIAQRGVESDLGTTLLEKISSQSLTHLRVLSETVSSYFTIGALRNAGDNATNKEFSDMHLGQLRQLFAGHPEVCSIDDLHLQGSKRRELMLTRAPLLTQDPFNFLASCSAFLQPALHLDVHQLMRMCYIAEVVRVIVSFLLPKASMPEQQSSEIQDMPATAAGFIKLTEHIFTQLGDLPGGMRESLRDNAKLETYVKQMYRLAHAYALPFLRKCVILMHVRYGVEFPLAIAALAEDTELVRLSEALHLPSFDEIIATAMGPSMLNVITGWIHHWLLYREGSGRTRDQPSPIPLSHPAIFELVGLPKNFDTLQDEAMRRKCPKTGKDQTDPVVCLFCGDIFCSQAVCCKDETDKGGCWQHRQVYVPIPAPPLSLRILTTPIVAAGP
jgi:E3 ubiquitin-protein ligase UBR1